MRFAMRFDDGIGVRRLRQTDDEIAADPVIDEIYPVFALYGQVLLMCSGDVPFGGSVPVTR